MDGLETQMSVNADNYDGFEEMRSNEFSDKVKELKSEIHTVEKEIERRKKILFQQLLYQKLYMLMNYMNQLVKQ